MIRVHLDGLVKHYGPVAALDGASLELPEGAITAVLGPAGAGKSTLARVVSGLEPLDAGEIYFGSRIVQALPAPERQVGLVFQGDALWTSLTAAETVGYALKLRGLPRQERRERVSEALNAVRLDTRARLRPDALSPLERQRLALARALATRPEFLIVDEPLAGLEGRPRDDLMADLRRLHDEGRLTTLWLTRDPQVALAVADHLAVLDLGKIVQVGPPSEVYNVPADAFVARLLGPTNLIEGQVEGPGARGEVIVRTPLGRLVGRVAGTEPAAGAAVTLSVRPEALALGPGVPPGSNRFAATVERVEFLGATRRVSLRGPGEWPVTALALQSQSQGLRPGQSITVALAPEHVVVLAGSYAAGR